MQRYLAFRGDCYYPSQGMGDFVGDFAKVEDAVAALTDTYKTREAWDAACMWALVWDSESRSNVWDVRANLPAEACGDWPRKDNDGQGL